MCLIYAGSAYAMYGIYVSVQINRCVCVTVLHRCTAASVLSVQVHVHLCVCEVPPARGAGLLRSAPGAGPVPIPGSPFLVPGSWFPVPGSWFPSSRRRGITWPWGTTSPWPGRSRCSAPLKVSVGPRPLCEPLLAALGTGLTGPTAGPRWGSPGQPRRPTVALGKFIRVPARRSGGSRGGVGPCWGVGSPRGAVQSCSPGTRSPLLGWAPTVLPLSLLPAGGVLRLREGGGPCTDTSPHLVSLCQLLESILRKGLRRE